MLSTVSASSIMASLKRQPSIQNMFVLVYQREQDGAQPLYMHDVTDMWRAGLMQHLPMILFRLQQWLKWKATEIFDSEHSHILWYSLLWMISMQSDTGAQKHRGEYKNTHGFIHESGSESLLDMFISALALLWVLQINYTARSIYPFIFLAVYLVWGCGSAGN